MLPSISRNFQIVFPALWRGLHEVTTNIDISHYATTSKEQEEILQASRRLSKEIGKYLHDGRLEIETHLEEWKTLRSYSDKTISYHTIRVIYLIFKDPDFAHLSEQEQNALLWAGLFHDIAKRGRPLLQGKDPLHPYTGTAAALNIMYRFGWLPQNTRSYLDYVCEYINRSYVVDNGLELMDISRIKDILSHLYCVTGILPNPDTPWSSYSQLVKEIEVNEPERLFELEVLLLVLLHQFRTFTAKFPNASPLNDDDVSIIFSPRLFRMTRILVLNDSLSYLLVQPELREKVANEINATLDSMNPLILRSTI